MDDMKKNKAQHIAELAGLRKRNADVEAREKDKKNQKYECQWGDKDRSKMSFLSTIQDIINVLPQYVIIIDEDHNILLANDTILTATGKSKEEIEGCYCPKLIHGIDEPFPGCPLEEALEKGQNVEKDLFDPFYKRWVSSAVYHTNYETEDGKKIFFHIAYDITDRKKSEEIIKQQNEFFENIIESLTQPFYVIDADDYTIKIANPAANFGKLTEKSKCYILTHREDKPCNSTEHPCPIEEIKKTKKPVTVEHIHYNKDGNTRMFEVHGYPVFDGNGKINQIIEYTFDITEQKQAESALLESEERFRTIVEAVPSFLLITNILGDNIYVSPNCKEIIGYKQEEMLNKVVWWVHEDDTSKAKEIFGRSFQEKIGFKDFEYKAVKKNGDIWYASSSFVPIKDNDGNYNGFVMQTLDITERKKMEKQLKKTQKKLEIKSNILEEKNIALKVLFNHQEEEKKSLENNILRNVKTLIYPSLEKLKEPSLNEKHTTLLEIIETNLSELIKPFSTLLMDELVNLSPSEVRVANMVKEGKTAKEIAEILYISEYTVKAHLRKIRLKLGIKNKKINLRSYLQSLIKE